ncbi:MAG TPA: protein kinase [Candidatus Eisenbacteria bacterium]|nr:protein kinase [Candidatus Eisenbacteria bacterium]
MSFLEPGRQLAHYRIESRLGAGGMGEVYRALDTKLGRTVAIKVLPAATVADPTARRRLLDEARAAASLTHPHIVTIYSVDESEGSDFIVMEYVEGKSLKERLDDGPLDVPELLRVGIDVADALAAAHAIGLIHRDIKPANILLTSQAGAKVLDFGIAKRMASATTETIAQTATNVTGSGLIVGTVAYMAPEQARGETLDGRADVFSLGATLYEAATGRQAFEGSTTLDTMVAVATKTPVTPTVIRPELPADLDVILGRALAKRRDDRYGSSRELADALRALREGTGTLTRGTGAFTASPVDVPNNLPTPMTSFIGRARERSEVQRLLGTSRVVTLLGFGGSGKTRLAIQVAKELQHEFKDGVWLAEFEALSDPTLVPQQVARAIGVKEEPGIPIADTIAASLQGKKSLIVLDNCEQVASAVAFLLSKILPRAADVRVLATSREPLAFGGEVVWRIPTLSVPDPRTSAITSKDAAGRFEAIRLFVDRAQAVQPAFLLTDKNASAVAQVCHHLDGIPLAIELAAVRVKVLPVEQILARLKDRFALLTGGSRTALPRQQTLRATVDWSYEMLSEQEKKLLNRVSVFAGGFSLETAEAVCAWNGLEAFDVLDTLGPLLDKSLVVPGEAADSPRYSLLETIRDYAAERLKEAKETEAQDARHALHFFKLALQAEPELQGRDQAEWFALLDREHENIRRATRYHIVNADAGGALLMAGAIWRYWWTRGFWEEGRRVLHDALALPDSQGPTIDRAKALYASAVLARGQGDFASADAYLAESLPMARGANDKVGEASALFEQGNLANARGDLENAARLYQESLAIRREIEDRRGLSLTLHNLAVVAQSRGGSDEARRLFEEALGIHRELGNAAMEAHTLNGLTDIALHEGDLDAAQRHLEQGLAIQRELGNKDGIGFSLRQLGEVATRRQDATRARVLLKEALEIFQALGDSNGLVDMVDSIAGLAALIGQWERALLLAHAGGAWRQSIAMPRTDPDTALLERSIEPARAALGADEAAAASVRGEKLTPDEVVRLMEETLRG